MLVTGPDGGAEATAVAAMVTVVVTIAGASITSLLPNGDDRLYSKFIPGFYWNTIFNLFRIFSKEKFGMYFE